MASKRSTLIHELAELSGVFDMPDYWRSIWTATVARALGMPYSRLRNQARPYAWPGRKPKHPRCTQCHQPIIPRKRKYTP